MKNWQEIDQASAGRSTIRLFLCGDVMTGRGIDQILPFPSDPILYEDYVKNAQEYVHLAERVNGKIPKPVNFAYIWGDVLEALDASAPDIRIINLETSVTRSSQFWKGKGINYRMNPKNVQCLTTAKIDCCCLANNHILDWGYSGLDETLLSLQEARIKTCGAGKNIEQAFEPAVFPFGKENRIVIFSFGSPSSGVPKSWEASQSTSGVNWLDEGSPSNFDAVKDGISKYIQSGDLVIVSIHWGANWGFEIPAEQQAYAHKLIDEAQVDLVYGHSSHHAKGVEVYRGKPIFYGCGDFLNDYEGIFDGYERFRGDLCLIYLIDMKPKTRELVSLSLVPMQVKCFRINYASKPDCEWLRKTLDKEYRKLATNIVVDSIRSWSVNWKK